MVSNCCDAIVSGQCLDGFEASVIARTLVELSKSKKHARQILSSISSLNNDKKVAIIIKLSDLYLQDGCEKGKTSRLCGYFDIEHFLLHQIDVDGVESSVGSLLTRRDNAIFRAFRNQIPQVVEGGKIARCIMSELCDAHERALLCTKVIRLLRPFVESASDQMHSLIDQIFSDSGVPQGLLLELAYTINMTFRDNAKIYPELLSRISKKIICLGHAQYIDSHASCLGAEILWEYLVNQGSFEEKDLRIMHSMCKGHMTEQKALDIVKGSNASQQHKQKIALIMSATTNYNTHDNSSESMSRDDTAATLPNEQRPTERYESGDSQQEACAAHQLHDAKKIIHCENKTPDIDVCDILYDARIVPSSHAPCTTDSSSDARPHAPVCAIAHDPMNDSIAPDPTKGNSSNHAQIIADSHINIYANPVNAVIASEGGSVIIGRNSSELRDNANIGDPNNEQIIASRGEVCVNDAAPNVLTTFLGRERDK